MTKILLVAILVLCHAPTALMSQSLGLGTPGITNFLRSDYQAGTQNWAIQQDHNGIVYFANNKGVVEYDGTNWATTHLPNRTIARSLAIDKSHRLYVGGQNEFGVFRPNQNGQHNYVSLLSQVPESLHNFEDVWKILFHQDKVLFCTEKAIFVYDGTDTPLQVLSPDEGRFEHFFQLEGAIFVQDQNHGLFRLSGDQLNQVSDKQDFAGDRIVAILPHPDYDAMLVTATQGLFVQSGQQIIPWNPPANAFLKQHQAYCAIQMADGNYAIGSAQNGLLLINQTGEPVLHLSKDRGLQNNTVLAIMQDQLNNLWLGLDNGIDYIETQSSFSLIGTEDGIAGTGYAAIVHNGLLYLGTNQGLYARPWDTDSNTWSDDKFRQVNGSQGQVWNINQVDDQVIIGQHKGASYLEQGQLRSFSSIPGAWKFMPLMHKPGYALEGTYTGFVLYQRQGDNWVALGPVQGFEESARVFEEDEQGAIWVSHAYLGLYKLTFETDVSRPAEVVKYDEQKGMTEPLLVNVSKIRDEIIFTSPKGIFRYDQTTDRIEPHTAYNDIFGPGRNVHRIQEDQVGNIWFAIDEEFGILKVENKGVENEYSFQYFNQIQEDLVDGFEHIYASGKNHVFIGSERGFIYFRPNQHSNQAAAFQALVREVTLTTGGDTIIAGGAIKNNDPLIHFAPHEDDFRFAFTAPFYEKPDHLYYRYQLEGFEEDWSPWTQKTEKEYTNLLSGDYVFRVQARNAFGHLSQPGQFAFSINESWYWSWWSRPLYVLLGCLMLLGVYQSVSLREKRKSAVFRQQQNRKLAQTEAAFKKEVEKSEGEIIKLRNEKLQANIKHKNSQLASATMHLVQKSEMLNKIKKDLKEVQGQADPDLQKKIRQITRTIESDIHLDDSWDQFETYFDQVHENFFKRLRQKHPNLTPKDQKLCAYLRMNLSTKEIAPLLNISVRGVEISRYRLRKKLELPSEVNLVSFMLEV